MDDTRHGPTDTDGAARATSDELMSALAELADTETRKRSVPTDSPEFLRLAQAADDAGRMVARWTGAQLEAATQAVSLVRQGAMSGTPIEQVAPRPLSKILARWREAQHRLRVAGPGTAEELEAASDLAYLADEYQEARAQSVAGG